MNDPDVLTQCIDLDLEFETPACSQPFQPIRMDSQLDRKPGVGFCILADSAGSSLAKPVTNETFFGTLYIFGTVGIRTQMFSIILGGTFKPLWTLSHYPPLPAVLCLRLPLDSVKDVSKKQLGLNNKNQFTVGKSILTQPISGLTLHKPSSNVSPCWLRPDSQEDEEAVKASLVAEFEAAAADQDVGERTPKRLKRSNAFLEDSYDAKVAHYDGVKHFNVLTLKTPLEVDTVDTDIDTVGTPKSGSNEIPSGTMEEPSVVSEGVPGGNPGVEKAEDESKKPEPNNMDDDEEAKKKDRQAEMKRRSSNLWHEKWISKGVPRVPKDDSKRSDQPVNMRDACAQFVAKWISESGMQPSNERRKKAYEAWMSSDERAKLLAGKSNVQGWLNKLWDVILTVSI